MTIFHGRACILQMKKRDREVPGNSALAILFVLDSFLALLISGDNDAIDCFVRLPR
jgi:hypothetical protein